MDIDTVLTILAVVESKIETLIALAEKEDSQFHYARAYELRLLTEELQDYIEQQVAQVEGM